jgi:hypothetical protein
MCVWVHACILVGESATATAAATADYEDDQRISSASLLLEQEIVLAVPS